MLVLSPLLVEIGRDLDVSTGTAGQLRTLSGLVAGVTALLLGRVARRLPLRDLLRLGALLLTLASVLAAVAPSFAILALAQLPTGIGLAILVSAGVAGAAEWVPPGERARVLGWALAGQAVAWIVGMPLVGLLAEASWRLAFLVPLGASLLALLVLALCAAGPRAAAPSTVSLFALLRDRVVAAWAVGELLAFSAWAGILVYAGALLIESYDASPTATGVVLGGVAAAYLPGNFLARRVVDRSSRALLITLALAGSLGAAAVGLVRPALGASVLILAVLGFIGGARTLAGSTFGLDAAPERKLAVTGVRASATQFGYLVGSLAGGAALAAGGYRALGLVFAALYAAAAVPHVWLALTGRAARSPATL